MNHQRRGRHRAFPDVKTPADQHREALPARLLASLHGQPCLADAGLTADDRHRQLVGHGPVQHAAEHSQLITAANQCRACDPRAHTTIIPAAQAAQKRLSPAVAWRVRGSPYPAGPAPDLPGQEIRSTPDAPRRALTASWR
jgi:hypothetical protein